MPNIEWVPWKYVSPAGEATYFKGENRPTAVVLHRMQGWDTTAHQWALSGHYGASWHYTVGRDGTILQHLGHTHGGYHAGIPDTAPSPTWTLWRGHGQNVNHYCVTPNTPILTPDLRWVLAGDLREGDGLLGFDELPAGEGRRRRLQDASVVRTGFQKKPVYRVLLRNGDELLSTAEHRWLVRGGQRSGTAIHWMETLDIARAMASGRTIAMPKYFPVKNTVDSYAAGFLAAALSARSHQTVQSVEFVGEQEIVELGSSSLTYIANGYGAHNTIGVECEGFAAEDWPAAQLESLRWLCRKLSVDLGIPYDREHFPAHAEIDVVNRGNDFDTPERRHIVYDHLFRGEEMADPRLDAVVAALGGMAAIEAWNARGNSLLAGYALEQEKLGAHLAMPHGGPAGGRVASAEQIARAIELGAKAAGDSIRFAEQANNGG